jgi:hypothetical protein
MELGERDCYPLFISNKWSTFGRRKGAILPVVEIDSARMSVGPFSFSILCRCNEHVSISARCWHQRYITIPLRTKEVLDVEFADDTCLFLKGNNNNLVKAEHAIQEFCLAPGARINWNKTMGLWISQSDPHSWLLDPNF